MHEYAVGKLYIPGRTSWPEGGEYNYRGSQHELRLFFRRPSAAEVDAVRQGPAEFGLVAEPWVPGCEVLVLLYRFGGDAGWSDAPYSWHLVPPDQRTRPEPEATAETRALLHVLLVDADTGLVQALRVLTLSPDFTRLLHAAIRAQALRPWRVTRYDARLAALYQRYPTSEALLERADARCVGGA